jgi:hypothetical protein
MKTLAKVVVTIVACGLLYRAADWHRVTAELVDLDGPWLAAALTLFVPQTIVSAWRWRRLIAAHTPLSLAESVRHTLAASTWNLIMPSKLGDFSKAAFVTGASPTTRAAMAKLVGVEKVADLAALAVAAIAATLDPWTALDLLTVCGFGSVVALKLHGTRSTAILEFVALTAGLWVLHLAQIHAFMLAARIDVPWTVTFARVPLALVAGVLPAAFCGIGTRDAALVWLFADYAGAASLAAVGLLTALRYVVPGAAGIPLLWRLRTEPKSQVLEMPQPVRTTNRRADTRPNRLPATRAFESSATP